MLRGDVVKDDSGSYAVFCDKGSSASHMIAAKIFDVLSRLPGCAGEAGSCVSTHTGKLNMPRNYGDCRKLNFK